MYDDLSYFSCPLPEDIARLVAAGDLTRARKVIDQRLSSPTVPQVVKHRLQLELRILNDLPRSYPYTEAEILAQLQEAVEGFTQEELDQMRDNGTLDWVYLDGKVRFRNDGVDSLLKTQVALNDRFTDKASLQRKYDNFAMLDKAIATMKQMGHSRWRYQVEATLHLREEAQRPGEKIRVWIPLPINAAQSKPLEVTTQPQAAYIADEKHPQRTAYFETLYQPGMTFQATYTFEIDAPYAEPQADKVLQEQPTFDLEEQLPQIQFTPFISALVKELSGDETNPLLLARRFYDYCTKNTCYRYVPPYYMKTNIPEYFGVGQRGDCGMHALLFITLCRAAGIPAQWQSGYYCRPGSIGDHDWARYYIAPYGWLYCDPSFGGAAYREGHLDRWNFYFANLEPFRMVANTAIQQTFDPPYPFLRSDPYDSQDGEVAWTDGPLHRPGYWLHHRMVSFDELTD